MEQEITPAALRTLLKRNKMKQKDLEPILDLTNPKISAIMNGHRKINSAEQKLLQLYFWGKYPFTDHNKDITRILEFTIDEWELIKILSTREGYNTPKACIIARIREYLTCFTHHFQRCVSM